MTRQDKTTGGERLKRGFNDAIFNYICEHVCAAASFNEKFLLLILSLRTSSSISRFSTKLLPAHEFISQNLSFRVFLVSKWNKQRRRNGERTTLETCKERSKTEAFFSSTRLTFCYSLTLNNASGRQNFRGEIARRLFFITTLCRNYALCLIVRVCYSPREIGAVI